MKKILFLDIDNTLYSGKSGIVPESAMRAVNEARANGHPVFLCTGRSKAEASRYLAFPVDGFIFSSGTLITVGGKTVYDHPIAPEKVEEIAGLVRSCGMGVLMGGAQRAYLDAKCWGDVVNYFSRPEADADTKLRDMRSNGMAPMEQRDRNDPVYKMGASTNHGTSFEPLLKILPPPFRLIHTLSSPEGDFGDISDGSIMKSDGIRRVLEYTGMNVNDSVGIGDSGNDIDMIRFCGTGIAMGNADEEVKQAADWVTSDIDEDGIRNAFLHLGVIG